jgi:hypothetical protein
MFLISLGVPMPGGLPALPKPLGFRTTRSRIPEEAVCRHIKEELLRGRTSLSKLGTEMPNAPDFGKGRPIMIQGPCQSGKTQEMCTVCWLAYFCYETVPFIFVMNAGGLGMITLILDGVARFNKRIDDIVKKICPHRSSLPGTIPVQCGNQSSNEAAQGPRWYSLVITSSHRNALSKALCRLSMGSGQD